MLRGILRKMIEISRDSVGGLKTSPPPQVDVSTRKHFRLTEPPRCGNCRHWGKPGDTDSLRECFYPVPKHLNNGWSTRGNNNIPCATWEEKK